jgi:hypothetical protein
MFIMCVCPFYVFLIDWLHGQNNNLQELRYIKKSSKINNVSVYGILMHFLSVTLRQTKVELYLGDLTSNFS